MAATSPPVTGPAFSGNILRFDDFTVDTRRRELLRGEEVLSLSPKQFDVLEYMVRNPDRVLTKQELLQGIWPDSFVQESNLSQNVFWLRKVLQAGDDDEGTNRYIATVPGRGYRFIAVVFTDQPLDQTGAFVPPPATLPPGLAWHENRRLWAVAAIVILLATAGFTWQRHRRKAPYQPSVTPEVIVAQIQNGTGDPSLTPVLNGILRRGIAQSPVIYVVPRTEINKTLKYMQMPLDTVVTATTGRQICVRRNATAVVETSIVPQGSGYQLTVEAVNCVTGRTISVGRATAASSSDVLVTLDSMVPQLRKDLGESPTSLRQFSVPVENATTASLEAFKAFLAGEDLRMKGETVKAVPLYLRAISLDQNFALAHLALGSCYQTMEERDASIREFTRANDLAGRISPRERLYVEFFFTKIVQGDMPRSIVLNEEWERLYPKDPAPWTNGTDSMNQLDHFEDAIRHGEKGLTLFPEGGLIYVALGQAYLRAGRYDDLVRIGKQAVALKVDGWQLHEMLWQRDLLTNDTAALAEDRRWVNGTADEYLALADDVLVALQQGRIRDAMAAQQRMEPLARAQGAMSSVDENRGRAAYALAELGLTKEAHAQIDSWKSAYPTPEIGLGFAFLGETARAQAIADALKAGHERDTLVNQWRVPVILGAIALSKGTADGAREALAALAPAAPLDLHDDTAHYLRGKAYLKLGQDRDAEKEFMHLVESPGANPFAPLAAMTKLQLARARAKAGDIEASRVAYQSAIAQWKSADTGLPALQQAKLELANLK